MRLVFSGNLFCLEFAVKLHVTDSKLYLFLFINYGL